ncbi:helix-turn-helix transcriptional regulator [Paenibacillus hexagrammi]|uniref:AraC family transcriptional regulator n=1 Tax=Paenibacillus hexagrammi TaxID=2908839 RepID=A0ABY3SJA2_9BACL|nr:AraC family transcriptional regulator [Paenibacillus sp. YPD9-1]UJF33799.1 AraC family transcriptional regulator [Paenibacillus sp. YPD9-1]
MQDFDYEQAHFVYYTPRKLDKDSQIWPVRAGSSQANPNYRVGPKRIDGYSLHQIHQGELWLEHQGERISLVEGDLFCLFPGITYHYGIANPASPLRLSWIVIDGPRAGGLLELAGLRADKPYTHLGKPDRIGEIMECIRVLMGEAGGWSAPVCLELQSLLFRLFAESAPEEEPIKEDEPAGWIQECIRFMELHAAEGVSVQQTASFAGVHRSYFTSVFTREVGISPLSYLQKIRMEKAQRLLRDTDATITEIALSLGYPNLFSFTRAFKNYCSVSPGVYRTM